MKMRIIACLAVLGITTFMAIQSFIMLERAKAITSAIQYKPESYIICNKTTISAIHTETGAKHTFSTDCLPPGWTAAE